MAEARDRSQITTTRIEAFSDGVFAIAITLLALQLQLPAGFPGDPTDRQLVDGLWDVAPSYFTFILSFLVIGRYWLAHHDLFRRIKRSTTGLASLNLLLLLTVVAIPFPTELLGLYGNLAAATIFYAASLSVVGLILGALWRYADRHGLLYPDVTPALVRQATRHSLLVPAIFLASIPVALVSVTAAELMWLSTFAVIRFVK